MRNKFRTWEEKDFHYEATYYPVNGKNSEIIGGISVLQDITHLLQSEIELQRSYSRLKENEERLQETRKFATIGNWERNLISGETNWEAYLCKEIYEIPETFERTFDNFLRLVHPEDRPMIPLRGW